MHELDWDLIRKEKDAYRERAASLPFDEKLRVMEQLRDRAVEMRGPTERGSAAQTQPASNIHISVTHSQNMRSVVGLAVFGASATLAAAMVSRNSSSNSAGVPGKTVKQTG